MRFSVIIPVYNRAALLVSAIESVRAQSFPDFELIVTDDGSTDDTQEKADACAAGDKRIRVIHQENGGVCKARNAGLDAARGEYIVFLDSDNTMRPEMLSRLDTALSDSPDLVVFGFDGFLPEAGDLLTGDEIRARVIPEHINIRRRQAHFYTNFIWNKCYRRAFLNENTIRFDPDRRTWEDGRFVVDCLACADSLCLFPENIYNSKSETRAEHLSDRVFRNQLAKYVEDETLYRERFHRFCDFSTAHYIRNNTNVFRMLAKRIVDAFPEEANGLIADALRQEIVQDWFARELPEDPAAGRFRDAVLAGSADKVIRCVRRETGPLAKVERYAVRVVEKIRR